MGNLALVHRCARSVCCFSCAVLWATWLMFTSVPARCVACVCGVLGHLAPVHRCARLLRCFACAVSRATWLLFTGVPARCVVLRAPCPGPLGSCSPVCPLGVLCCVCGVLGPLAVVHRCARPLCYAVSWATWLLFTGVRARCVVLWVACAGHCCRALTCPSGPGLFVAGRAGYPRRALSSVWTAAVRSRQRMGTLRVHTRPSGQRLFRSRQGAWFAAGRAHVRPDGGWCCLAPVLVLWFVACCARFPALRHPAAVPAWHLSVCLGCGRRPASLGCLMARSGAPRLVQSGRSRCSSWLSRCRGAFPHPGGLRPLLYCVAARGTRRPPENQAHCACRRPPRRQGRWASSASYPFGAPQWGCPWRVPLASVLGCVRCDGWRVWTRSLTRSVSCTVRRSTGDSAGAPGLFFVDADTAPCRSEDATPGSHACVRVLALLGRIRRAGLTGAFWCASPFPLAWPTPGWGCCLGPLFALPSPFCFFFSPVVVFFAPPLSLVFFGFRPRVP